MVPEVVDPDRVVAIALLAVAAEAHLLELLEALWGEVIVHVVVLPLGPVASGPEFMNARTGTQCDRPRSDRLSVGTEFDGIAWKERRASLASVSQHLEWLVF